MNIKLIKSFKVKGLSTRTRNSNETNEPTAKIAPLWEKTRIDLFPHLQGNSTVYGVYSNYESDATGEFDVLAGADSFNEKCSTQFEEINIKSGKYLVFSNSGEMPKVIIDTWGEIWEYFSNENSEHKRAYTTDFEKYKGFTSIEVYISIK